MATSRAAVVRRLLAREVALPPEVERNGTRGRILEAGLRLFAEFGFAGASIRDLAAEAGVQTATLYAHFPSKEHLLAELILVGHEEHHRRLRAALLASQPDPREQLTALVQAHVAMHAEFPMLATVANAELHALTPDLGEGALALRDSSTQLFIEVVDRGVQQGVFATTNSWLAVAAIGGMGIRVASWYTAPFELTVAELADAYAEFALAIVRATPPDG